MVADRSVTVRLRANVADFERGMAAAGRSTNVFEKRLEAADSSMGGLLQTALALGPALIPIGAVGIPAITGLANELGVAALAGGSAIIAFQGIGDALKAMSKAHLEPTVENLAKAQEEMQGLAPAAQHLVTQLYGLRDEWAHLKKVAANGLLPGVSESIDNLETRLPQVERIVGKINKTLGELLTEGSASLAGNKWDEFFHFLKTDATSTLSDLGHTVGNLTHALAEMWMAFAPLNNGFSNWLVDVSHSFDGWATGLSQTKGFEDFVNYIRTNGPQVAATLGALGSAIIQIVEAAAPLGGPTLQALEAFAKIISTIADSPIGTPILTAVGAMAAWSRVTAVAGGVQKKFFAESATGWRAQSMGIRTVRADMLAARTTLSGFAAMSSKQAKEQQAASARFRSTAAGIGKGAAAVAGLTLAYTGAADSIGVTNTVSLALMGTLAGPFGAAIGAATGAVLDFAAANNSVESAIKIANAAMESGKPKDLAAAYELVAAKAAEISSGGNLQRGFALLDGSMSDLDSTATSLRNAMNDGRGATGDFADVLVGPLKGSLGLTAAGFDLGTSAAGAFAQAILAVNDILSGRAGWRDYEASIDAVTAALEKNGKNLRIGTEAGRENQAALDAIAGTALKVAETLKGVSQARFLTRARKDFINAATDLGMTEAAAKRLATRLGLLGGLTAKPKVDLQGVPETHAKLTGIDKSIRDLDRAWAKPKVTVNPDPALTGIGQVQHGLAGLHNKDIIITTFLRNVRAPQPGQGKGFGIVAPKADGGRVVGPGGPRDDMVPARLSHGEYVIKAKAVDKYGIAMFDRLNSMAYADGGSFPRTITRGGGSSMLDFARATGGLNDMAKQTGAVSKAVREHAKQVAADRKATQEHAKAMLEAKKSFKTTVAESFNHDIFGKGLAGAMLQLQADANDSKSMQLALRKATKLGLNPHSAAFKALAGSGDLTTAHELDTRKEIRAYEKAYANRAHAQGSLGSFAAGAAFGKHMEHQTRVLEHVHRTMSQLDKRLDHLEGAVERGTFKGAKAGTDANNRAGYGQRGH